MDVLAYAFQIRQQRSWRRFWALSLSAAYSSLWLFAVLCLATGVFHPEAHHDHHAHDHQQHHDAPPQSSGLQDICDFALHALTTTAQHRVSIAFETVLTRVTLKPPVALVVAYESYVPLGSRAPPCRSPNSAA